MSPVQKALALRNVDGIAGGEKRNLSPASWHVSRLGDVDGDMARCFRRWRAMSRLAMPKSLPIRVAGVVRAASATRSSGVVGKIVSAASSSSEAKSSAYQALWRAEKLLCGRCGEGAAVRHRGSINVKGVLTKPLWLLPVACPMYRREASAQCHEMR